MDTVFWSQPYGKTPTRLLSCRWEGNVKMFLTKLGNEGIGWIQLVHVRPL
jgi:hypothetical protein